MDMISKLEKAEKDLKEVKEQLDKINEDRKNVFDEIVHLEQDIRTSGLDNIKDICLKRQESLLNHLSSLNSDLVDVSQFMRKIEKTIQYFNGIKALNDEEDINIGVEELS